MLTAWPVRLPDGWRDNRIFQRISTAPVRYVVASGSSGLESAANQAGLTFLDAARPPSDVEIVKGEWPGVRGASRADRAEAGPTGAPWVDSNGWSIRLARTQFPGKTVWSMAEPAKETDIVPAQRYVLGVADAAAHGGRWVLPLDRVLAEGLVADKPDALNGWKQIAAAMRFFDAHAGWADYPPRAVLGVLSDFGGENEFLSQEILNLAARRHLPYLILQKAKAGPASFRGLKAVVYPDAGPPPAPLRDALLGFVREGGLLIAGPKWGKDGTPATGEGYPRFELRTLGKGRLAVGTSFDDPYVVVGDVHILLSHRYDVLRFYNAGILGSYLTAAPNGGALLHLVNYTGRPGPELVTARVAGRYRAARLWTFDRSEPAVLKNAPVKDALEIEMPPMPIYGAIELIAV